MGWAELLTHPTAIIELPTISGDEPISKPLKNWTDEEIYQKVGQITRQFNILECIDCAKAIRIWLRQQGISGKVLKLKTRYGEDYILSARLEKLGINESITINGQHVGVEVCGQVFDNLSEKGQPRDSWIQDFQCHSGQFLLSELDSW